MIDPWRRPPLLEGPLVLLADLLLLLGREVVLDPERLPDLLRRLAPDHVGDLLAAEVQQRLDVEVVGGQQEVVQRVLVDLNERLVEARQIDAIVFARVRGAPGGLRARGGGTVSRRLGLGGAIQSYEKKIHVFRIIK